MRQLRTQFEIKPGVKVDVLFTPHLYSYKGVNGVTFEPRDDSVVALLESYADVMYSAALNAWELDGRGTVDNFPHKRGDFHEWMTADAKSFGDAINFALAALTGKTASELSKENSNQKPAGKKKLFTWTGLRLKRS